MSLDPWQVAVGDNASESAHQKALFMWAAMARLRGFDAASDPVQYTLSHDDVGWMGPERVPVLKWLYSSPNGGLRTARTAARMKAEGAKPGVADIFLPVFNFKPTASGGHITAHGLYIELKKITGGRLSDDQIEFRDFVVTQRFQWHECRGWTDAAKVIRKYLE